jgi:negative regulator of replication initiation
MRFHVGELLSFKSSDTEMVLESIQDTLDRLLAIEALCETSTRESVKASWPITAQHYVQDIVDAMVLLRTNITQQQQVIMDMHIEEIKTFLANTVYNIDMQVQNLLN